MKKRMPPFEFKQCVAILRSTGKKAGSLRELRKIISEISDESIFHHTYQYFLKGHIMEYTNDFAHWVGQSLEERALAEHLSNMDPYVFKSVSDVRKELVRIIDKYLNASPEPRRVLDGNEFYFIETVTLIFSIGVRVKNLAEFLVALKQVDAASIYFHFYEARMRLGGGIDDFSRWINDTLGKKMLAKKISRIDPFMHNMKGIRRHITELVEEEVRTEMEAVKI